MSWPLGSVVQDVKSRAAFQVIDDFTQGVGGHWDAAGLVPDPSGAARVAGFTLNRSTMQLAGYRLDFDAQIGARGLGWVIGASDENNYYAFKLEAAGAAAETRYRLVRYQVSEGRAADADRVRVDVPLTLNADYNRISVRLRENNIATFINGTGVDYWQAPAPPQGGIGFFTEGGESALVRRVEVSGNDDNVGLFVYGLLKLFEDAAELVEPYARQFRASPTASLGDGAETRIGNAADAVNAAPAQ
jgi:hypothetical protein